MASEISAAGLDGHERGLLLALFLLGAEESALPAIDEDRRVALRLAWQALCAADEPTRARTLAAWRAEAASALPEGLLRLHPSWIEDALADERAEVVAMIRATGAAGSGIPEETSREIARLAFGHLGPLCESEAGPLAERLCALGFDDLISDIARRGARVVGRSLAGTAPALRARAMAAAGEPWAQEIAAASAKRLSPEERAAAAELAAQAGASEERTPRDRLLAVGLAALKAELAAEAPGSCLRVAGRLPAPLGRVLAGW
ncbi:MAG: hypothetical protein JXP73_14735 [Deltaproteobacteria bacterium]|nr:hypothetical protein [Deltaproteobacteria bacterium]